LIQSVHAAQDIIDTLGALEENDIDSNGTSDDEDYLSENEASLVP